MTLYDLVLAGGVLLSFALLAVLWSSWPFARPERVLRLELRPDAERVPAPAPQPEREAVPASQRDAPRPAAAAVAAAGASAVPWAGRGGAEAAGAPAFLPH